MSYVLFEVVIPTEKEQAKAVLADLSVDNKDRLSIKFKKATDETDISQENVQTIRLADLIDSEKKKSKDELKIEDNDKGNDSPKILVKNGSAVDQEDLITLSKSKSDAKSVKEKDEKKYEDVEWDFEEETSGKQDADIDSEKNVNFDLGDNEEVTNDKQTDGTNDDTFGAEDNTTAAEDDISAAEDDTSLVESYTTAAENISSATKDERRPSLETQSSLVVLVPKYTALEFVKRAIEDLEIEDCAWTKSDDNRYYKITFIEESGSRCEHILRRLQTAGVGQLDGSSISVIPLSILINKHTLKSLCNDEENDKDKDESEDDGQREKKVSFDENEGSGKGTEEKNKEKEEKDKKEKESEFNKEFKKSIKSRLVVDQVVQSVRNNALFTFDYMILVLLASLIAATGLVENSSVVIVASMLISPLMGPILAIVFGIVIRNGSLWKLGLRTELIGLLMCIIIGFVFGLVPGGMSLNGANWGSTDDFPTIEMSSRGVPRSLGIGLLIALPSGAGVALSVLGGNMGSLVGVAISASLLPPIVNAGVFWALSFLSLIHPLQTIPNKFVEVNVNITANATSMNATDMINTTNTLLVAQRMCPEFVDNTYIPTFYCEMWKEAAILGLISLILAILNILCIILMGVGVLKLKEVAPMPATPPSLKNFFHTDITIARKSYMTHKKNTNESRELCQQLMQERMKHEKAKIVKRKKEKEGETSDDEDAEEDRVYRTVTETIRDVCESPDVQDFITFTNSSRRNIADNYIHKDLRGKVRFKPTLEPISSQVDMFVPARRTSGPEKPIQQRKYEVSTYKDESTKTEVIEEDNKIEEPEQSLETDQKFNSANDLQHLKDFDKFMEQTKKGDSDKLAVTPSKSNDSLTNAENISTDIANNEITDDQDTKEDDVTKTLLKKKNIEN
ncbi:uncharacterized protein LOC126819336 [Patella vulgata]|uniref:uncharacterized protein LOC126819336 n=1 Tax=Patella vulgata TaxID=6465 RepID=UPI0024A7C1C3|nr:uncharacterized protein LOC126819336 [Patella vulgata]